MLKFSKHSLIILFFLSVVVGIYAKDRTVGLKSLSFGVGVREIGMGGVGVASAAGPFSFYFNPAIAALINRIALGFSYADWLLDTDQTGIFFLRPTKFLNFGFGLIFFDYGKIELRRDKPEEAMGEYSPKDITLYFNLARALSQKLTFGTSLRYFYERIYTEETKQWGLDLGFCYRLKDWQVGFSYLNWGDVLKLKREKFYLPAEFRIGISSLWRFANLSFRPAFDYTYSPYEKVGKVHFGGEIGFKEIFLRMGIDHNTPTFGIGVKRGIFSFDYSFTIKKEFSHPSHHFAIGLVNSY